MSISNYFSEDFIDFCRINQSRGSFLHRYLDKQKIPVKPIIYQEAYNLYIGPQKAKKILVAHYDRVPGTPGANDNSAAVFQLLKTIEHLHKQKNWNSTALLLTDLEEFHFSRRDSKQGAYGPALELAATDPQPWVFVFDMCGIGDTLILSDTWDHAFDKNPIWQNKKIFLDNWIQQAPFSIKKMTLPYSDDLAFIQAGIPAFLFSMLPQKEIPELNKWAANRKLSQKIPATYREYQHQEKLHQQKELPPSWRVNHTPEDTISTLWPESFELFKRFLFWLIHQNFN